MNVLPFLFLFPLGVACGSEDGSLALYTSPDGGKELNYVPCADMALDTASDENSITDLAGTGWVSGDVQLALNNPEGMWSDGCSGGHIPGPFAVSGGNFEWDARSHEVEPQPLKVSGFVVSRDALCTSFLSPEGELYWGPMLFSATDNIEIAWCD